MSKLNVKILQYKQIIWRGNYKYSIELGILQNMTTFDDDFCLRKI